MVEETSRGRLVAIENPVEDVSINSRSISINLEGESYGTSSIGSNLKGIERPLWTLEGHIFTVVDLWYACDWLDCRLPLEVPAFVVLLIARSKSHLLIVYRALPCPT